jgi:hypothetical protein
MGRRPGGWWLLPVAALAGCHYAGETTSPCFVAPPDGATQSALFRVGGGGACGSGGASVTTVHTPDSTFQATIRFAVHGALPRTTYVVQRAPELGDLPLTSDGACQRAQGLPPWNTGEPPFLTFLDPITTQARTLVTDAAGDGALEFIHRSTAIASGTKFDVQMRLVDDVSVPTTELRSGCMTVFVP